MPTPALRPSANKSKVAVLSVIAGQMSVSEVCARYGVHRSCVYKLLKRYQQYGAAGLEPAGKAPIKHGKAVPGEVRAAIIRLRHELYSDGLDNGAKDDCLSLRTRITLCSSPINHLAHSP
jgi:transposase-like protein